MAEGVAPLHVGQMDFDKRDRLGREGIAQGNAGVRLGCRINDDETDLRFFGRMKPVNPFAFMNALERL